MKLHLELRPKKYGGYKDKGKAKKVVVVLWDVGSNSSDDSKLSTIGIQGKGEGISVSHHSRTSVDVQSSSSWDEKKRGQLFHVRIITKHTKIDVLFYSGSQVNFVSEEVGKKLDLATIPHEKTYPLRWFTNDAQLQVTKKCILKFAISDNFKDEVEFDVVPLDICGIVLGNPYLYDRKTIFYREKNQYHPFEYGIEYVIHAH